MTDLLVALLPEMLGLVITPGAVVACLLLLDSTRPVRNVTVFALAFVSLYALISVVVLVAGSATAGSADHSRAKAWIGVGIGALFLVGAVVSLVLGARRRREGAEPTTPAWVTKLEQPDTRTVALAGLALSALNPNLAILVSGLTTVVAADVTPSEEVVGALLLLGACLLDFVVPSAAFLLLGARAKGWLDAARSWLVRHDATIGIVVLAGFGTLFLARGLTGL